ncbi:MAG: CapA family protein [Eubacteriales bacterium]|jgi:poly-gamma-glutamate synthesis protein (capsule biosynthesis protein)
MNTIQIIIGGDLAPTKSNVELFNRGDILTLIGAELMDIINKCDFRIFNLEVPLTDKETPIFKCGSNLIAPTSTITGIKALNPSLITLANNHILDQGKQGLNSTETLLSQNGISYIGTGDTLNAACRPYIIKRNNVRIGVYACAEHEFSIATTTSPGANPFDPLESLDHIAALKAECDYIIVLYHGGKEHYRYPSPHLQKICRKMSQKGANVIVCQHSHCIGCFEEYGGSTIVYGQGNFLFDDSESEFQQTGFLLKVSINDRLKVEYIPIIKTGNSITLAYDKKADDILKAFRQRSEEINQDGFIEQHYRKFALENRASYLRTIFGFGKWISRIDRRLLNGMLIKIKFNKRNILPIRNYIECEAHRELLLEGLRRELSIE